MGTLFVHSLRIASSKSESIALISHSTGLPPSTNLLEATRKEKKKRKHIHKINFSNAAHLISRSIKLTKRKGGIPPDLDAQIINDTSPVREGRRYKRVPHAQTYPASNYRAY